MFNAFLDGSKPSIESAIANATGLQVPKNGLAYPSGSVDDIPNLMRPQAVGGVLEQPGMVEVVCVSTTAHRSPMTSVKACGSVSRRI